MKIIKSIFFLIVLLTPLSANAYLLNNLRDLSNVAYQAGTIMQSKNANLSINQSYEACKAIIVDKYNPAVSKNMNYEQKKLLNAFSPSEVTYCFMGYLRTKPSIINSVTNDAYLEGRALYKNNVNLNSSNSYIACQNGVVRLDDLLAERQNTTIYKQFLYYAHPAQDTYCWVGYLDAAGANK